MTLLPPGVKVHLAFGYSVSLRWRPPCGVSFKYGNCPYGQS
jgi:hypothetical protein